MIAQILHNGQVYNTPVVAYRERGWRRELVVFNRDFTELILLKTTFGNQAFILNREGCACSRGGWRMEPWLEGEALLWKALCRRKRVSVQEFPLLQAYAIPPQIPDWYEMKTELDVVTLMSLCMGFHDSRLIRINSGESCIELRFDTSWGCYLTLRCLDVVREEGLRENTVFGEATLRWNAERGLWHWSGGVGDGAPQVLCRRLLWHPTVETRAYRKHHRNYKGIEELWEDLSEEYPSVTLRDGVITLINGDDRMEVWETSSGYVSVLNNGKKEIYEDQVIYWAADDFMTEAREPAPNFIWQFTPSRKSYALWLLPRILAVPVLWLLVGLVLALTREMGWIAFGALCALPVFLSLLIGVTWCLTQRVPFFGFTKTKLYVIDNETVREASFAQVKDFRLRHFWWRPSAGSVRIRLEKGRLYFFSVENVDEVGSMLTSQWISALRSKE